MIYVGLDDTDVIDSPGTNKIAKSLAAYVSDSFRCQLILRHQLLFDPRVPYTSKNSSATVILQPLETMASTLPDESSMVAELMERVCGFIVEHAAPGSDPGVCVTNAVPETISAFGQRCQQQIVTQRAARHLANEHALRLVGLGGTDDGVIGALAAVGLAATHNDGRVVMIDNRDDLCGVISVDELQQRGVRVRCDTSQAEIATGLVQLGKHLRPNMRDGQIVQYVRPWTRSQESLMACEMPSTGADVCVAADWEAVRRP